MHAHARSRGDESRPTAGARWPTILIIVGAGIVSAFQVGKAPTALAAIQADLALDLATASWLLSAFALIGALSGMVIGVTVDNLGARRLALGGLLLQAFGSAAGAAAEGAALLLATRVIEGVGFLTVTVAAPTLIVALARPSDRGRAIAVWGTFMPIGIALVMLGAPLLTLFGWRGFWLANAVVMFGYAGLLAWATRTVSPSPTPGRRITADVRQTLAAGGPWLLAGLFGVFAAAYFAVFGFLPSILSDRLAIGTEAGSLLAAAAVAVNALGNLACGPLLARGMTRARILLIGFGAMGLCGFGILNDAVPGILSYGLCVVFSAVSGLVPVALLDGAPRHAPRPDLVGATVGMLMQGNNVGLVFGPMIAGAIATVHGWSAVAYLPAVLAVAASILAVALRSRPAESMRVTS